MDNKDLVSLLNESGVFPGFFEVDAARDHVRYVRGPDSVPVIMFELRAYRSATEDFLKRLGFYGREFNKVVVEFAASPHSSAVRAKRIAASMHKLAELKQTTARNIELGLITVSEEDIQMAAVRLDLEPEDVDKLLGMRSELAELVATEIMENRWQDVLDQEIRTALAKS